MRMKRPRLASDMDVVAVVLMVTAAFALQAVYLHTAFKPITDEGVYSLIGKLMMRGFAPHADFPMYHMPLLPFLMGIGQKLMGGLYPLRLIYLAVNCLAVFPLFFAIRKATGDRLAAVLGIAFYLTFYEMMAHDFRMLAIRQSANVLFIVFLWCGVCAPAWRWRRWTQLFCAVASAMLFLPAVLNIAAAGIAIVLSSPREKRDGMLRELVTMLGYAVAAAGAYLLLMDGALQQVVADQMHRESLSRWHRVLIILGKVDLLFIALACTSLMLGMANVPRLRAMCGGMLAVFAFCVFLSTNYFAHYVSLAGPALAFGAAVSVPLIRECLAFFLKRTAETATLVLCALLVAWQSSLTVPLLLLGWRPLELKPYDAFIASLSVQPEPVLIAQALYAADSGRLPVLGFYEELFRPPVHDGVSAEDIGKAERSACTIVLDNSMRRTVPPETAERWLAAYRTVHENELGMIVLRTGHPGCGD